MSIADFFSRIFRVTVKSGCSRPCRCVLSIPSSSCLSALVFFQYPHRPLTPQRLQGKPAPLCSGMERVAWAKPSPPWPQQLAQSRACDPGLLGSSEEMYNRKVDNYLVTTRRSQPWDEGNWKKDEDGKILHEDTVELPAPPPA